MLVLTRRARQSILFSIDERVPEDMTVHQFFSETPMIMTILEIRESSVRFGIDAPAGLKILRDELGPIAQPDDE